MASRIQQARDCSLRVLDAGVDIDGRGKEIDLPDKMRQGLTRLSGNPRSWTDFAVILYSFLPTSGQGSLQISLLISNQWHAHKLARSPRYNPH